MNDLEFQDIIEQLKLQEEETEKLEQKIVHLTNDMTTMAHVISKIKDKLDKTDLDGKPLGETKNAP